MPADAISSDGRIALSAARATDRLGIGSGSESGPVSGRLTFGEYSALADRARADWADRLLNEVPLLVLAALFGIVFLGHLLLFARRRENRAPLVQSSRLVFAINTPASTYWIYELT